MLINFHGHKRVYFYFFELPAPMLARFSLAKRQMRTSPALNAFLYVYIQRDEIVVVNVGGHAADGREKKIKNYLHKKGEKKRRKKKNH